MDKMNINDENVMKQEGKYENKKRNYHEYNNHPPYPSNGYSPYNMMNYPPSAYYNSNYYSSMHENYPPMMYPHIII